MKKHKLFKTSALLLALLLAFAACGGGGSSGSTATQRPASGGTPAPLDIIELDDNESLLPIVTTPAVGSGRRFADEFPA